MTTDQPTETPTPRTDANLFHTVVDEGWYSHEKSPKGTWCDANFARQLETELTAAQAEIARLKEAGEKMKSAIKAKWGGTYLSGCQCRYCQALAAWEKLK